MLLVSRLPSEEATRLWSKPFLLFSSNVLFCCSAVLLYCCSFVHSLHEHMYTNLATVRLSQRFRRIHEGGRSALRVDGIDRLLSVRLFCFRISGFCVLPYYALASQLHSNDTHLRASVLSA